MVDLCFLLRHCAQLRRSPSRCLWCHMFRSCAMDRATWPGRAGLCYALIWCKCDTTIFSHVFSIIDLSTGPISLHLHHCPRVYAKVCSLCGRCHQHCRMVGRYRLRHNIHSHLGIWNCGLLEPGFRCNSMAGLPLLSSDHHPHSLVPSKPVSWK